MSSPVTEFREIGLPGRDTRMCSWRERIVAGREQHGQRRSRGSQLGEQATAAFPIPVDNSHYRKLCHADRFGSHR